MNTSRAESQQTTLLDLVRALSTVLDDDAAVASAVAALVNSGAVRFSGRLKGRRVRVARRASTG